MGSRGLFHADDWNIILASMMLLECKWFPICNQPTQSRTKNISLVQKMELANLNPTNIEGTQLYKAAAMAIWYGDVSFLSKLLHKLDLTIRYNVRNLFDDKIKPLGKMNRDGIQTCVEFLMDHGLKHHSCVMEYAAKFDLRALIEFMLSRGAKLCEAMAATAAEERNLDLLKYLFERGCPRDQNVCINAAHNGDYECLKYAREHGAPWNSEVAKASATGGSLACLKYVIENDVYCGESVCNDAAASLECLKYLVEEVWIRPEQEIVYHTIIKGNLECLKYVHNLAYELNTWHTGEAARWVIWT